MLAMNVEAVPRIQLMGFVSYQNPWIHFKRNTDEYILYFIKSGELHIQENGNPYVLRKGDVFLLEPNLDHEGLEKHVCDYYYVHFAHPDIRSKLIGDIPTFAKRMILEEGAVDEETDSQICYFPKHFTLSGKPVLHQAFHAMDEIRQLYNRKHYNRNLTALKFSGLLIEWSREYWMAELHGGGGKNTKSFMKVHALLEFIHEHYAEKITGADIERTFECNFDYINRVFKQITGYPIAHYVNRVRIQHAKELIQATHLSIGEIGYLAGLDDPYYFSKVFKKHVGLSPIQYYKTVRENQETKIPRNGHGE